MAQNGTIKMSVENKNTLVIKIRMDGEGKPSKSGKTLVIATTGGNVPVEVPGAPEGLKIGINMYVPA